MNTKALLVLACLLAAGGLCAQDRANPDGNTDTQNPRNPVPQGPGAPPFGHGQTRESRFTPKKDETDTQTRANPTDRDGSKPETPQVESNPTPSRTDVGSPRESQPDQSLGTQPKAAPKRKPLKRKKSREQLQKDRGAGRAPRSPVDKELPAVSDPAKDGALIEDAVPPEVPQD